MCIHLKSVALSVVIFMKSLVSQTRSPHLKELGQTGKSEPLAWRQSGPIHSRGPMGPYWTIVKYVLKINGKFWTVKKKMIALEVPRAPPGAMQLVRSQKQAGPWCGMAMVSSAWGSAQRAGARVTVMPTVTVGEVWSVLSSAHCWDPGTFLDAREPWAIRTIEFCSENICGVPAGRCSAKLWGYKEAELCTALSLKVCPGPSSPSWPKHELCNLALWWTWSIIVTRGLFQLYDYCSVTLGKSLNFPKPWFPPPPGRENIRVGGGRRW